MGSGEAAFARKGCGIASSAAGNSSETGATECTVDAVDGASGDDSGS